MRFSDTRTSPAARQAQGETSEGQAVASSGLPVSASSDVTMGMSDVTLRLLALVNQGRRNAGHPDPTWLGQGDVFTIGDAQVRRAAHKPSLIKSPNRAKSGPLSLHLLPCVPSDRVVVHVGATGAGPAAWCGGQRMPVRP